MLYRLPEEGLVQGGPGTQELVPDERLRGGRRLEGCSGLYWPSSIAVYLEHLKFPSHLSRLILATGASSRIGTAPINLGPILSSDMFGFYL